MIDEDIELYSLFRKGDRKAFDTLFLKYYSILCAFGKYYIPIEDAEEVVLDMGKQRIPDHRNFFAKLFVYGGQKQMLGFNK